MVVGEQRDNAADHCVSDLGLQSRELCGRPTFLRQRGCQLSAHRDLDPRQAEPVQSCLNYRGAFRALRGPRRLEILRDLTYQHPRNDGSIVLIRSSRVYIIKR